jgi:HTH-type transcriptional regulator/antitoxin HigA
LNKKRKLTVDMIRKLNASLGISTEVLIREY